MSTLVAVINLEGLRRESQQSQGKTRLPHPPTKDKRGPQRGKRRVPIVGLDNLTSEYFVHIRTVLFKAGVV